MSKKKELAVNFFLANPTAKMGVTGLFVLFVP